MFIANGGEDCKPSDININKFRQKRKIFTRIRLVFSLACLKYAPVYIFSTSSLLYLFSSSTLITDTKADFFHPRLECLLVVAIENRFKFRNTLIPRTFHEPNEPKHLVQ
jgi:ABC-type phosphate/phosphonate transport system permease subunit